MTFQSEYEAKKVSMAQAAALIENGDRIICTMNGTPYTLMNAIGERWEELENVTFFSNLLYRPLNFLKPEARGRIDAVSYFKGVTERQAEKAGVRIDTLVYQLHQHDQVIYERIKPTVACIHVTPFDEEGYCLLGPNTVGGIAALACAGKVIAQVNDRNPRMNADPRMKIHISQIDALVEVSEQMPEFISGEPNDIDRKVAEHVVEQIADGSTIQLGIGGIANAVGYFLESRRDLGVHTEMYTESMVHLTQKGIINNSKKTYYPGVAIVGFSQGTQRMYDFVHENPAVLAKPIDEITKPWEVAKNDNMISLNGVLGVDLLGQISSESIGFTQFSGVGGQLDFVRGAQMARGGKSFLAMHSTVTGKDGRRISKVCLTHPPGTAVTVPRTDVQYVATEYGLVNLKHKGIEERARLLISIAHPDFRDQLSFEARQAGLIN